MTELLCCRVSSPDNIAHVMSLFHNSSTTPGTRLPDEPFIWIVANEPIRHTDSSMALEKRRVPIYAEQRWSGNPDVTLVEQIEQAGLHTVFNAVMQSMSDQEMVDILQIDPGKCPNKRKHFLHTNPVARWVEEKLWAWSSAKVQVGRSGDFGGRTLMSSYHEWCSNNGESMTSSSNLFVKLLKKALEIIFPGACISWEKPNNKSIIRGVGFKEDYIDYVLS